MDDLERRTPREKKIRRAIIFLSSCQTSLGAMLIAMSFTAFASSSSDKIRSSCPYWAGFTVLFTGAVGFLTWKQLSIISIGIYTFLSAVSVIVHLVATVLTGDTAAFLKSLQFCWRVNFEYVCKCCVDNTQCKSPYKFPSVRHCRILNGFLKDIMYGLCAGNVVCCLICLMVTVMGCTLVAQYSRYSRRYRFRWSQRPRQDISDHRYNWFAFPSDLLESIPPRAPPIYYPVQSNSSGSESRYRRPPTVFDPVDFPPPYTSREPSLCGGALPPEELHEIGYIRGSEGTPWNEVAALETGYLEYEGNIARLRIEDDQESSYDSVDHLDYVIDDGTSDDEREQGSSSGAVLGLVEEVTKGDGSASSTHSTLGKELGATGDEDVRLYLQLPHLRSNGRVWVASSDSDSLNDNVFTSTSSFEERANQQESGTSRREMLFMRGHDRVHQRRHSCPQNEVYCARDEIYRSIVARNVNPWGRRTMSEQEARVGCERQSPVTQRRPRANSIPCCATVTDPVLTLHKSFQTPSVTVGEETSGDVVPGDHKLGEASGDTGGVDREQGAGLFRHFKERKTTRRHKRSKRPRNNPDHILERETGKQTSTVGRAVAKENYVGVCKETNL